MSMRLKPYWPYLIATLATLPGLVLRLAGVHLPPIPMTLVAGSAILGASFLLLWACDAAQADISATLALAVVALIAVLPEYAVDMYFTWQAGKQPAAGYAHYAIANMTGANRLLVGVAWGVIAAVFWIGHRREVRIGMERRLELFFLGLATLYAFVIPIKGSLTLIDGAVFLGIYIWYVAVARKRPVAEFEGEGPAELLLNMPARRRKACTIGLFIFAAAAIVANAEPFSEGLLGTGRQFHINEFLLVQWLAPIASEAPEFIVAIMFAYRGQAGMALGSLLSSKLNQWTLLVGMIPGVYAISSGTTAHPLPMDHLQLQEILLTAAQSLLAVVMLASLRLGIGGALLLFVLFSGQLVLPQLVAIHPSWGLGLSVDQIHPFFSAMYVVAAAAIWLSRPKNVHDLLKGLHPLPLIEGKPVPEHPEGPLGEACLHCRFRLSGIQAVRSEMSEAEPKKDGKGK